MMKPNQWLAAVSVVALACVRPAHAELTQKQVHQEMLGNAKAHVEYTMGNYVIARTLWQQLAAMGNASAMQSLGNMYREGNGVVRDDTQAFQWFQRAAAQGQPRALYELSLAFRVGRGTQASALMADNFLERAAFAGIPEAQLELGESLLASGQAQDARHWLTLAERNNAPGASQTLQRAGKPEPTASFAVRQRTHRFYEELDSALNSRDLEILAMLFTPNAQIAVRLPGEPEPQTLPLDAYLTLWKDTFDATERFRAHRSHINVTVTETGLQVNSKVQQYLAGNGLAQQLNLDESLLLVDTAFGLRIQRVNLKAALPDKPILAPVH